jgi:hypothetical protein
MPFGLDYGLASNHSYKIVNNRDEMEFTSVILHEHYGLLVKEGFSLSGS